MHRRAFTLVEILISVGIISIITAIVLAGYQNFASKTALRSIGQDIIASARLAQTQATGAARGQSANILGSYTLKILIRDQKLEQYSVSFSEETEYLFDKEQMAIEETPPSTIFSDLPFAKFTVGSVADAFADVCFIVDNTTTIQVNSAPPDPRCGYSSQRIINSLTATHDLELNVIFRPYGVDVVSYIVKVRSANGEVNFNHILSQTSHEDDWGVRLVLRPDKSTDNLTSQVSLDFLRTGEVSLR